MSEQSHPPRRRFLSTVLADYRAYCAQKKEGQSRQLALMVPRILFSGAIRGPILMRLTTAAPLWLSWLLRNMLLMLHACDISSEVTIGPGLITPHPLGIVITRGVVIGNNVVISHNVTIGGNLRSGGGATPRIGDDVRLFPGCVVVGDVTIGDGAIIGANTFVDRDVAPAEVFRGGR